MTQATEETKEKPAWVTLKPAEVEKIVIELHKQGNTPAKIGLILRDKHGIPKAKLLGKRIKKILEDAGETVKTERSFVEEKVKKLEEHRKKNIHDYSAQKSISKKLWVLKKLPQ